jgi:hypothetical protein
MRKGKLFTVKEGAFFWTTQYDQDVYMCEDDASGKFEPGDVVLALGEVESYLMSISGDPQSTKRHHEVRVLCRFGVGWVSAKFLENVNEEER